MSTAIGSIGSTSQVSLTKLYQELFKKLDQDGDGKVKKTEFAAAGKTQDSSKVDELFSQIDTDGDGSITGTESEAFLTKMDQTRQAKGSQMPPPPPPDATDSVSATDRHKKMFDSLDQNGDGKVDKTEFAAAGKTQDSSKTDELFSQIDTDGDGSITGTESEAFLTKMDDARKSREGSGMAPGQEWQIGILQAMLTQASQGAQASQTSMSLYA